MLVDSLNAVRWAGKRQRGFYEVWYMTLVDPTTGDSFWFRYTLTSPSSDAVPITAGVWGFSSSGKDPKAGLAVHDVYPIAKLANKSTEEKGFRVEVGTSFLERARAKGKVGSGDRSLEWDLTWEPKGAAVEHVSPALEAIGLARSSVNAAHAGVLMSGTVKVGGKSVKVDKWAGEQAHTWGKRHADQWAWAHCNAFAEDPGIVFEGVSARTSCLGMCLPTATPLYLRLPGSPDPEEHAWTSATTIFSNRSTFAFGRWDFEAESSDILDEGHGDRRARALDRGRVRRPFGRAALQPPRDGRRPGARALQASRRPLELRPQAHEQGHDRDRVHPARERPSSRSRAVSRRRAPGRGPQAGGSRVARERSGSTGQSPGREPFRSRLGRARLKILSRRVARGSTVWTCT